MLALRSGLVICWALSALSVAQSVTDPSAPRVTQRAQAESHKPPDAHLVRVQTITAPGEFATTFFRPFRCDSEGDVYVRTDSGGVEAVHKLNSKGEKIALFEANANPDLKIDAARYFTVGDRGELYELVYPHEMNRYVFVYKADGTFKSAVKLQTGFPWIPKMLAVFPTGQLLASGEEYDADKTAAMWPFTGIFAADGGLLKEVKLEDDEDLHDMAASGDTRVASPTNIHSNHAVDNGLVEMASDGNAYLMRWTNPAIFYAISPGGEVVRRFAVDPGEPGYRPSAMHVNKNRIAILFVEMQSGGKIMKIVDLEGHEIAKYDELKVNGKAKDALSAVFVCYTENPTHFVFLGADDDNRLQLWHVEPR